jgi:hypothetical protein
VKLSKVVVALFAAAFLLFLVVGLILPREWKVEVTTPTHASAAQVLPRVRDFREWNTWAAPIAEATYSYSDQQGLKGSWMSWKAPTSRAKFILGDVSERGVKFDEMMEGDEVNAHGEIVVADGTLVWRDSGKLPPVIGGYFRGMMERALAEHMRKGLEKLKTLAESAAVAQPVVAPAVVDSAPSADAGEVGADAGAMESVDGGGGGDGDAGRAE